MRAGDFAKEAMILWNIARVWRVLPLCAGILSLAVLLPFGWTKALAGAGISMLLMADVVARSISIERAIAKEKERERALEQEQERQRRERRKQEQRRKQEKASGAPRMESEPASGRADGERADGGRIPPAKDEPACPRGWREVLGVEAGSGAREIRRAYRSLAMRHHPDRGGDGLKMAEINRAWGAARKELGIGRH